MIEDVVKMVSKHLPEAKENNVVTSNSHILEDLEYDSLAIAELFEEIEEKYGIDCYLDVNMRKALGSVEELCDFLNEKVGGLGGKKEKSLN